jgi:23S rRNA (uridine2479-2'-O)-methyltransferase
VPKQKHPDRRAPERSGTDAPGAIRLADPNDALFRRVEFLKTSRTNRRRFGEFLVEGVKPIDQARRHRWPIHSLIYVGGRPLSSWARETLAATPGARHVEVSPALMERLSDKHYPSDLVAVVAMPSDDPARIQPRPNTLVAAFGRPSSPGNLGSVIRSCHALGADGLIVTGHGTDVYNPQTVRASMGSLFALPTVRLASAVEVRAWVRNAAAPASRTGSIQIVGTAGEAALPVDAVDLSQPTLLVFGNEATGLTGEYRELCDVLVRIPMHGGADSINVACAAAVLLYEADRQRRRRPLTGRGAHGEARRQEKLAREAERRRPHEAGER